MVLKSRSPLELGNIASASFDKGIVNHIVQLYLSFRFQYKLSCEPLFELMSKLLTLNPHVTQAFHSDVLWEMFLNIFSEVTECTEINDVR